MQNVVCDFVKCGCRSQNGFCLNRLVKITNQGQCQRLLKRGWSDPIENEFKSTYDYWKTREPVYEISETESKEEQEKEENDASGNTDEGSQRDSQ